MQEGTVRHMFEELDEDGDGLIPVSEFEGSLKKLGIGEHCSDEQVRSLAQRADLDGDGCVDLAEFAQWLGNIEEMLGEVEEAAGGGAHDEETDMLEAELFRIRGLLNKADSRAGAMEADLRQTEEALRRREARYEDEASVTAQFWQRIAQSSASPKLEEEMDLGGDAALLSSGRYGFVVKARRRTDGKACVAKLMSVRWAHVASREWHIGQFVGEHPAIVAAEYDGVLLHADTDRCVAKLLLAAIQDGTFKPLKRTALPDRYISLTQEYMNRGTVQEWMDTDRLTPAGLLAVMRRVAEALAFLHSCGVSHNDCKPANILLALAGETGDDDGAATRPGAEVTIKLGDLGLASKSSDHTSDFSQYGMTTFCMATGERFGTRKFRPALTETFVTTLSRFIQGAGSASPGVPTLPCAAPAAEGTGEGRPRVDATLALLPGLLRKVWKGQLVMAEVRDCALLQGWALYDGGGVEPPLAPPVVDGSA